MLKKSKEDELIAKWLKNNTPTVIDTEVSTKDNYTRNYCDIVRGKNCSHCGVLINDDNVYVKLSIKYLKCKDTIFCNDCFNAKDEDKSLINKIGYESFCTVKRLREELVSYKEERQYDRRGRIAKLKRAYMYRKKTQEYKDILAKAIATFDERDSITKKNIERIKNDIKLLTNVPSVPVKKYLLDYSKIMYVRVTPKDLDENWYEYDVNGNYIPKEY